MSRVSISQFHSGLAWYRHRKVWQTICDCNSLSFIFMKKYSRHFLKFLRRGDHQSRLKHMGINIQKLFVMRWVKEFQEMVNFIVINLFNSIGVLIWNIFRVELNWKLWSVILNITVVNGTVIKSPRGSWNHRDGFGRRGPGFEVSFWRLDVPFSWWFIWFFNMKGVELIHISSKTWWYKFRATYDAGISLVSNTSTSFANTLLSHAESCNNWL